MAISSSFHNPHFYSLSISDCKNVIFNTSKVVAQKSVGDASTFVESEFSLSSSSWSWYVEKTAHSWFCNCLVSQKIVPKLTEVLTDTHPQVQSAWQTTLQQEVQNLAKKAAEIVVLVIDDEGTEYLISELLKLLLFPC
ncbi:unnamed protein product [Lactuca saligna]|uniref:Uncharacterized protein n=1 Tax=Lactuca saligna TaxID=75948 RepID=A0AA35YH10_LACSI|nr:unnamed protein product [Lactuca saligna]